jgi:hypothetical protein
MTYFGNRTRYIKITMINNGSLSHVREVPLLLAEEKHE